MRISRILIFNFIACSFIFSSCAFREGISPWSMSRLQKGTKIEDMFYLGFRSPEHTFEFNDIKENSKVEVRVFFKTFNRMTYHYVALAFVDGKMLYWGYPDEFCKNEDPLINKVGERLCSALYKDIND